MKAKYVTASGRITFEIEAPTAKDVFGQLASVQDVFDAEHVCSLCGSEDIRFVVRESEGKKAGKQQTYTYYELRCQGILEDATPCRGRFDFGQSLDTENLFPKRKDAEGNWMPSRGWYRYTPEAMREQRQPERSTENQRAAEPRRTNPVPDGGGMPDGLQPSVDRLAEIFGWRITPTRIGPVLDQINEEFERNMGDPGSKKFAEMYRAFSSNPARDAKAYKKLFAELVDYWNGFKRAVA